MANRNPNITGEWYHCYNRGVDKRIVFHDVADYERFICLLYICNGVKPLAIADRYERNLGAILTDKSLVRGEPLVDIGAYCLMPTHPHLLLLQLQEKGIARFMQKVCTGYAMYFNLKYGRSGALFAGAYKSKHISNDRYLKKVTSYILLNAAEVYESKWKQGRGDLRKLEKSLLSYPYSSLHEFTQAGERKITGMKLCDYYEDLPPLKRMLKDAKAYYTEISPKVKPSEKCGK